jgi:hypothetical protein
MRGIVAERITGVAVPYARQLCRLGEVHVLIGRALGERPGQRLMNRLGMPTGRQTLLRQVTAAARRAICAAPIRVLGVDDWAWNKGKIIRHDPYRSRAQRSSVGFVADALG